MSEVASFELGFPATLEFDQVAAFARAVSARPSAKRWPVLFELRATVGSVSWRIVVDAHRQRQLLAQLHAHLPNVRVTEGEEDSAVLAEGRRLGVELRLSSPVRPLNVAANSEVAAGMMAVTGGLGKGELVRLQWLVGRPLPRHVAKPAPTNHQPDLWERVTSSQPHDAESARRHNDKQAEPVVAALGRIAVTALRADRRRSLATAVIGVLRLSNQPSVHLRTRWLSSGSVLRRIDKRVVPMFEWPCPLNGSELATLLSWPIGGPVVSGVSYTGRRELPFAPGLLRPPEVVTATAGSSHHRIIGSATYPGRTGLVSLSPKDALQHLHVIGPTGVGKSTLLANLALQDIRAGRGVVVIEPKGDLVADILDRIPAHRVDDVVLLDPSDSDWPVGLNLLAGNAQSVEARVDALVYLFHSLFANSWGPRTQDVLHASLLTLARTLDMTLVELPLLLTDPQFRSRVLKPVRGDVAVGPFWAWFEALSIAEQSQVVAPVLNKVRAFTMRSGVRRILGQATPNFAVREIFTKRQILLVPLKRGEIGPETANLLGGLIVSQLWQTTQQRSALDPAKRHPVMLYLDEFQSYVHLPTDLDDVLAQARGLGLGMTLAHQHLGQLTQAEMRSAVLMNARSRIVFQTGPDEAGTLSKQLGGGLVSEDLSNLGRYEAYARLMNQATVTSPGSLTTLPLIDSLQSAGAVRSSSRQQFGMAAGEVDAAIEARRTVNKSSKSGGRRLREAS